MIITLSHNDQTYRADFSKPLDLSIPFRSGSKTVRCFYAPPVNIEPVVAGDFVGDTKQGGAVNFKNIRLNPHGNGTHTECVGHIAVKEYAIGASLTKFHYLATLISVAPKTLKNGDRVITKKQLETHLKHTENTPALIIRTLPNDKTKKRTDYSGTNPPYLHHKAVSFLVGRGVAHLLIDLPSVDREVDEGRLLAHKAFWQYPSDVRQNATITELIFVPDKIKDGFYLLHLGVAPVDLDAAPSRPVLYKLAKYKTGK